MFNLEEKITEWRRCMIAAGVSVPAPLDELESHLRDKMDELTSSGITEPKAFELAVARLGRPDSLRREFDKASHSLFSVVNFGTAAWFASVAIGAALLFARMSSGKITGILFFHILTLTAGYLAALLAGGFGIYYVCCQFLRRLSPLRQQSLVRGATRFTLIAAALVAVGLVAAMIWSNQKLGRFWSWDPREVGALVVVLWTFAAFVVQKIWPASNGGRLMSMCLGGNILVGVCWLGAGMFAAGATGYKIVSYWALTAFLALHFIFLVLAAISQRSSSLKRA